MSGVRVAVRGALDALDAAGTAALFDRGRASDPQVRQTVAQLIEQVRAEGDVALRAQAARFDGVTLMALEVPRARWDEALAALDPAVRAALEEARDNIAAFHRAQLPRELEIEVRPGVRLGRRSEPLARVGVYAPGGRAAYPSSVLMGVVPARVAGVREIIVCSPPGPDGLPHPAVLAACALAGADRVFALGGAGAIAALAYGTESVPRVDRVVGPGNAYVTEAKRALTGVIAIDSPAGPSEVLVLADASADAGRVAAELLAQAEHDPDAASVLVSTDATLPARVEALLAQWLPRQPRREIIEQALAARGALLTARDLESALAFAERYAPEHLSVMTAEPRALLPRLRAAGTIFLGGASSVAFGDYITGANHVLPTAGLARSYSGLSVLDFLRQVTYQELTGEAASAFAAPTRTLALAEGLPAHALAAQLRASPDMPSQSPPPLLRAAYRDIELYEPGRSPCEIDLSDNTNLFGVAPAVRRLFAELDAERITRYPTVWSRALKQAIADYHGVSPDNVATGCGSDDILDSAARAFAEPGERVAYPDPTFGVVSTFARMNALEPVPVPLTPELSLPVAGLIAARARLTYICSPNNPTGNAFATADIEAVLAGSPGIMLLDEAYADYDDVACVRAAAASERLIVTRTFSKAFGLAGLRVGYAIGPAPLIRELEKSRGPYKVGGVAEAAALAVLSEDLAWVRECIAHTRENRARLEAKLREQGLEPLPSNANFLLVPGVPAALARGMRERGVAVRAFPALPQLGDCIRVSIGPWPQLERFLNTLGALRSGEARGLA